MTARRLDAHVHVWDRARHPQPWIEPGSAIDRDFAPADLVAMLAATGADAAVLVQTTNALAETADLLAAAVDLPVAAVVGWVDLTADVPAQLDRLGAPELLKGVRHLAHLDPDPAWLVRADVAPGLAALAAAGRTFDLVIRQDQLPAALEVARAHPDLHLVLDHLANPRADDLEGWRRGLAALAAEPNVVAKLSGRAGWAGADPALVIDAALELFGPARLLYGSDWPVAGLVDGGAGAWAALVADTAARLAPAERDALLGGTCAIAYGIAA